MVGLFALGFLVVLVSSTPIPPPFALKEVGSPREASEYRLPDVVSTLKYNIKLVPYIVEGNFTFLGDVQIDVQAKVASNNITLHASKLTIDNSSIHVRETLFGRDVPVTGVSLDQELQFLIIHLGEDLIAGTEYTITIKYTGILDDDMAGFYRSSYVENGVRRWLATTQFEATDARRAFPCFDEPALKAMFTLHISRPENMRAVANMPQNGAPQLDTEHTDVVRYWDHFFESPRMSTYLVAFLVSDFVFLENSAENLRIFAQPQMISQARYALSISPSILNWMANYTGIPFSLPKMDEVAVPDFSAGAMENWGLVTYRERLLLVEEGVTTTLDKQTVGSVITHEYAHQWFGDLVSPLWWKFTWLNEGFATYFETFTMAQLEPTWRLDEQFIGKDVQGAMAVDALQSSHPMTNDVGSPASISLLFDGISYSKGGCIIRMMEHIITSGTFRKGLQRYLTAKAYDAAQADDLFASLNEQWHEEHLDVGDLDLTTIMQTWTLQMGYPVVNVTRDYEGNSATLTQERFLIKKIDNYTDTHVYKWHIPLTYTTRGKPDFDSTSPKEWFTPEEEVHTIKDLPSEDEWILLNIKENGYYRVNYDAHNWMLLTSQLKSNRLDDIHVINRAQLIDDSFNLARASLINYSIPLALSQYLEMETDYIVWGSAFTSLGFINRKLANAPEYNVFQEFLLNLIEKLYTSVGFEEGENDSHVLLLNRAQAVSWACSLGEEACIQKSKDNLKEWMTTPAINPVKPDIKSTVYCTALRSGGNAEWDFLWEKYLASPVAGESTLIISALGCSANQTTLRLYLETSVAPNSPIRKQDAAAVFAAVYNQPQGVDVALDYLIEDFENISQYFGGLNALGSLLVNIANRCNTQEQADKLRQFLAENEAALGGAAESAQRAIDIVEENLLWQTTLGQEIIDWIKANNQKTVAFRT